MPQPQWTPQQIITACEAAFPANQNACNAFVEAVGPTLGVTLTGMADDIVDQIRSAAWAPIADGVTAKAKADQGYFVVAGMKGAEQANPDPHGHVVVVVSGPLAHGAYPTGYWGKLGGGGAQAQTLNWAWNAQDRDRVTYACVSQGVDAGDA